MQLRNLSDRRTLVWSLVLFPLVPAIAYIQPATAPWLVPVMGYLAYCAGVLTHYHNHRTVFVGRRANQAYAAWLSIFYGAPIFTWIPTHNQNHHRYLNRPEDVTSTTRYTRKNTLFHALTYPIVSTIWQLPAIARYVEQARNRRQSKRIVLECSALVLGHAGLLGLALALHGYKIGVSTYLLCVGGPALFAPWAMMFTNYIQHIDCDPDSADNHSRNFVGRLSNWLVFNAGYHTVHHEYPGVHWSFYRELHERRARRIAPELNQRSIGGFLFKGYVLGAFVPGFRTRSLKADGRSSWAG